MLVYTFRVLDYHNGLNNLNRVSGVDGTMYYIHNSRGFLVFGFSRV